MKQDRDRKDVSASLSENAKEGQSAEADLPTINPNQTADTVEDETHRIEEERLKAYAHLLDSAFRLPGGFRVGLDGIVGLIPGVGDLFGALLSGYLIYGASKLDIPRSVIIRMIINTAIETVVGMVPLLGDVFDFVFKANDRNARLLHSALEKREAERQLQKNRH